MREPTATELELLRHALGADSRTPGYRNYFAAEPGSDDDHAWAVMALAGLAYVHREPDDLSPYRMYGATTAGKKAALLDGGGK